MGSAAVPIDLSHPRAFAEKAAHDLLQNWIAACDAFLQWQRKRVIERKPSTDELAEHREALKWMLRLTRNLHAQVADPDFPAPLSASEIAGKLLQLEESWGLIQESMSDAEADAILLTAFLNAPGTGSPH